MDDFTIAFGTHNDSQALLALYRTVAAVEGGLARTAEEITADYVSHFVQKSLACGVLLIARQSDTQEIIGEIHAYDLGPQVFVHVLGELTIAVHPRYQGRGVGKALFTAFLHHVSIERPDMLRVELIARESNQKAIAFYQKLGFRIEGKFAGRLRSVQGGYEADIPMAWQREAA